ncbi:MAG: hypothetical protein IKP58_15635 [Victivallales bacterium]|nr:hypothetical protein [Victivallales bacterium]
MVKGAEASRLRTDGNAVGKTIRGLSPCPPAGTPPTHRCGACVPPSQGGFPIQNPNKYEKGHS